MTGDRSQRSDPAPSPEADGHGGSDPTGTVWPERIQEDGRVKTADRGMMPFAGHVAELKRMFMRVFAMVAGIACMAFLAKDAMFRIVFAPSRADFVLYRWIDTALEAAGLQAMRLSHFSVRLINTELSSQFMIHVEAALYAGLLLSSPYVVYELFRFARPALYEHEIRYSGIIVGCVYLLFAMGLLMSYFIIFPVSFRFLGTYRVHPDVVNAIALSSYFSSFTLLSFVTGLVFEVPVLAFVLGKLGLVTRRTLRRGRRTAFIAVLILSAVITPPDLFTLVVMSVPLYGLYELSIRILPPDKADA